MTLTNGNSYSYQWDVGLMVATTEDVGTKRRFANEHGSKAFVVEAVYDEDEDKNVYHIPDILLATGRPVVSYKLAGDDETVIYVDTEDFLPVRLAPKPDNYVYTEEELRVWAHKLNKPALDGTTGEVILCDENGEPVWGDVDYSSHVVSKPSINGETLIGSKNGHDFGLANLEDIPEVPVNVSAFANDAGYVTEDEAAAAAPVQSVNGQTGDVVIDPSTLGLVPETREVNGKALSADISLDADDVGAIESPSSPSGEDVLLYDASSSSWKASPKLTNTDVKVDNAVFTLGENAKEVMRDPGTVRFNNGNDNNSTDAQYYRRSKFIPAAKGEKFLVKNLYAGSAIAVVAVYNSDKTYQSTYSIAGVGSSVPYNGMFTMPFNGYVRFCTSGSYISNAVIQNVTGKKELNILALGNSFTQDSFAYLPPILNELLPDYLITYSVAYYSSATIQTHIDLHDDDGVYTWFSQWRPFSSAWVRNGAGGLSEMKFSVVLAYNKWDVIYVQPASNVSEASIEANVIEPGRELLRILQEETSKPFAFFMGQWLATDTDGDHGVAVFKSMVRAMQQIKANLGINDYIPIGTGIQYARTDATLQALGTTGNMLYDGQHQQSGIPALISAYMIACAFLKMVGKEVTGIYNSTFYPTTENCIAINAYKEEGMVTPLPMTHGESVGVTADNVRLAQEFAVVATNNPTEIVGVTPSLFVPSSRTVNGKALSSNITLDADDVGAIAAPSSASSGQFLVYNGSAWVAQTVPPANGVSF